LERAKIDKAKAEMQIQTLKEQREEYLSKLGEYGLTEEKLPEEIEKLSNEITEDIKKLDEWAEELKAVLE